MGGAGVLEDHLSKVLSCSSWVPSKFPHWDQRGTESPTRVIDGRLQGISPPGLLGRLWRPEGVYRGVSPGRVPGCTEPRLRSLAVDSSAGEDQLVPASRVSAWERVRPRPGLGGSGVQPPPENSPCLVPRAPLAEGAAEADRLALFKKQRATLFLHPAPAPRGAGEEEEIPAFCAGDSWARLGIFPGCGHPGVTGTPRTRRVPGSWSRPGPGRERFLPCRLWTWGPCPIPSPDRPSPLEASELFFPFLFCRLPGSQPTSPRLPHALCSLACPQLRDSPFHLLLTSKLPRGCLEVFPVAVCPPVFS